MKDFHNLTIKEVLNEVKSSSKGLSEEEALSRHAKWSSNDIAEDKKRPFIIKFLEQFKDLMILILLVASAVSIGIGIWQKQIDEIVDGCIILAIVIMNAIFGLVQENKAEKSLDALKKMTEPEALVMRNGQVQKVNTKKLVVGDVVVLEAGSIVPADLRLIESASLQVDESSLTGESIAVNKNASTINRKELPLAERSNMCYRGCLVAGGRGLGVVVAVGKDTEIGKIAETIKTTEKEITPLQKNIKSVGKLLTFLVLGIAVVTFILEVVARPGDPLEAFLTAVAISVAAIPESMPAVITIIMSMGIARLAKQKAVVKHLHSVETLGCCDVICSDKTGTITQNKMTVTSTYCDGILQEGEKTKTPTTEKLLACMLLCNDCTISDGNYVGDATEIALCNYGKKLGIDKVKFEKDNLRTDEIPFDSKRKLMSTANCFNGENYVFTKGALDHLLKRCNKIAIDGKEIKLTQKHISSIEKANSVMADKALRVLGFAYKKHNPKDKIEEEELVFIGLVGMYDPPRKEIKTAVKKCKRAGMRAVMITGDHKETAFAVARECEIAEDISQVVTGKELDSMSDEELNERISNICVFARVSPENKVRIVETLKKQGHIVAMTGDGVNDAPSIKKANIGIGMGITGTDVTKEVADMLVTDDNFATIVVAVEEGRKIYQNIVKAVKFLFSANMGELMSLFLATIIFPQFVFLYPVQILFVNLITDSLPAIALGVEPPERDLMSMKPRDAKRGLFSNGCGASIITLGLVQTILTMLAYFIGLKAGGQEIGVTVAFYTLNIIQLFYLASMRTNRSMFKSNPFKNKIFLASLLFGFGLLALIAFTPIHSVLKLATLPAWLWGVIFGLSIAMMLASELFKLFYSIYEKNKAKKKKAQNSL